MKNLKVLVAVMFIVNVIGMNVANAQTYEGHGLTTIDIQRATSFEKIKNSSYKALFGTFSEARSVYRNDLKHITQDQLIELTARDIHEQMGEPFIASQPEEYTLDYSTITIGSDEWIAFCKHNEDGYVVDSKGPVEFKFGDPAKAWASQHKTERVILTITHNSTGRQARLFADCMNGIHRIVEQRIATPDVPYRGNNQNPNDVPQNNFATCGITKFEATSYKIKRGESTKLLYGSNCYSATIAATEVNYSSGTLAPSGSVIVKPMSSADFLLATNPGGDTRTLHIKVTTFMGRNAGWIIPLGLGVISGGVYLATHHSSTPVVKTPDQGPSGHYDNGTWIPANGNGTNPTYYHRNNGVPIIGVSFVGKKPVIGASMSFHFGSH